MLPEIEGESHWVTISPLVTATKPLQGALNPGTFLGGPLSKLTAAPATNCVYFLYSAGPPAMAMEQAELEVEALVTSLSRLALSGSWCFLSGGCCC